MRIWYATKRSTEIRSTEEEVIMWLVYVYIGFLLISQTEPYWNINSNEIDQYNPWNSINRKWAFLLCCATALNVTPNVFSFRPAETGHLSYRLNTPLFILVLALANKLHESSKKNRIASTFHNTHIIVYSQKVKEPSLCSFSLHNMPKTINNIAS